ncbi:MAG: GFA family protein [Azospirillaceae bacterium]|nr:GFA family protein [Azospirillaceae bacterium]
MSAMSAFPLEGGCDCRQIRYRMLTAPLIVHCCHCHWCQRESGASFAVNAMIEADRVSLLSGTVDRVDTPSESGLGQQIARCPRCHLALWSHYAGAGPLLSFVRVGTLDEPGHLPPDIHIFTESRQPWVLIPPTVPAVPAYYERNAFWPAASLERWQAILPAIKAYRAARRGDAVIHERR